LKAAIIAIGDELTSGYRLDTNSQAISRRVASVPLQVTLHLTASDTIPDIHSTLSTALAAADVVIATGGLGPTEDDLTRQAIASFFELELVEDAEALDRIRGRFSHRGYEMPESNRIQAHVPAGSEIIQNDRGTAPGFYLQSDDKHLFVTPGIPYEMHGMLDGFILPRLRQLVGDGYQMRLATLKVYGLPESKINQLLSTMMARDRNPVLGLLPHRGTITIEVMASGETDAEIEALLAADLEALREILGHYIISEDERDLPQVVTDLLVEHGLTVAAREQGTAGLLAARLTRPTGAERWFKGSVVLRPPPTPPPANEEEHDEAQTLAMASQAREANGSDIGVGVGPILIPEDSLPSRPYGLIPAAVDLRGQTLYRRLSFNGEPNRIRVWAADATLAMIRKAVMVTDLKPG
jgi:nicotinamide-nucleotide amidase